MQTLDSLPLPSEKRIALQVKPAAERALRGGHPWVFDESIRKQSHTGQPGDLAVIFDKKRRFLAIGLYDPDSPIRVRVLQHNQPQTIDAAWFAKQLQKAAAIRKPLIKQRTNGYRLLHGENDGLPGLIVDRYADTLVLKIYTAAWLPYLKDITAGLQTIQSYERLVIRCSRNIEAPLKSYGLHNGQILNGDIPHGPIVFQENGLNFAADVVHGHKTGFFFDQRENRQRVRALAANRHVLDVFAYSGGFSVYAAAGGAASVTSLDISAPALEAAAYNIQLNQENVHVIAAQHTIIAEDAFINLERFHTNRQHFDMLIVDPPAFAKSTEEVDRALAAYARLTTLALNVLRPGGILVMASCSSRVTADAFFRTVIRTADGLNRPLTILEHTSHALDHPISFPEGQYLKCLFAQADSINTSG